MSYIALYRKFRPQTFEDVKGQDHIVTTLKNQIQADRIGHAYLFCGTRGTGKTSVAKIFARAVNCQNPIGGSPCGECPVCKKIAEGTSLDVIEIDAASNNGVDNIREIKEEVSYAPTQGRYKVYIIDEVHMLSVGAFNALLKTLEEPPAYVIFILATTEVHKIPVTILSRCQQYDFRRISIDTITERMKELMEQEQAKVEEKALRYIAKAADGSMRDALSLLDQCLAFYMDQTLTYDHVLDVLGAVDHQVFDALFQKVQDQDVNAVIRQVEDLVMDGRELGQFVIDFTWYLRNLLLLKSSNQMEDVLDMSQDTIAELKNQASQVKQGVLIRYIRIFSELSGQMKYSSQKRILLEVALIKLCKPQMEETYDSLIDRVGLIEKKLDQGLFSPASQEREPVKIERPPVPKAIPQEVQEVVKNWKSIISSMKGLTMGYLKTARLSLAGDNRLQLIFEDSVAAGLMNEEVRKQELERVIEERIGKAVQVVISSNDTGRPFEENYVDLEKLVHMDITIDEDE